MNSNELTGIVEELKEQVNDIQRRVHGLENKSNDNPPPQPPPPPGQNSQG